MKNKQLSVCIIANSDGEYLEECVRHILPVADEIIIADIGAAGPELEAVKRVGAKIYTVNWRNDFSEIKNFCMEKALGAWVLFLYSDERIKDNGVGKLIPLLKNPNAEGYLFFINYRSEGIAVISPLQGLRLIRNHTQNRFIYRSFETLSLDGMENICMAHMDIVRQKDALLSWDMALRPDILAEEAAQNPEDGYLQYMSGIMLLNAGQIEQSAACFEKARQNIHPGWLFAPHLYKTLGFACLYLERFEEAMQVLNEGIRRYRFYTDFFVIKSALLKQLGRLEEAIEALKESLQVRGQVYLPVPEAEIGCADVMQSLGELYEQAFDYRQAFSCYCEAVRCGAEAPEVYEKTGVMARIVSAGGLLEEMAKAALAQEPEKPMLWLHAFQKAREYQKAADYVAQIEAQTAEALESVRNECRMMLCLKRGESVKNPRLSLEAAVRYCWFARDMAQADMLIKAWKNTGTDMENAYIYRAMHNLLAGKKEIQVLPTEEQSVQILSLHGDFLWLGQEKKAFKLLPLILKMQDDSLLVTAGRQWAARGNLKAAETIFAAISDGQKAYFHQCVLEELIRDDHLETAHKAMKMMSGTKPYGADTVIWAKRMLRRLQETEDEKMRSLLPEDKSKAKLIPDALISFYESLAAYHKEPVQDAQDESAIHAHVGNIYLKAGKKKEALCAYLKAMEADLYTESARQKALALAQDEPQFLSSALESHQENGVFSCFFRGISALYKGEYENALAIFLEMDGMAQGHPCGPACIAACQFFMEEAPKETLQDEKTLSLFTGLCRGHIQRILEALLNGMPFGCVLRTEAEKLQRTL